MGDLGAAFVPQCIYPDVELPRKLDFNKCNVPDLLPAWRLAAPLPGKAEAETDKSRRITGA